MNIINFFTDKILKTPIEVPKVSISLFMIIRHLSAESDLEVRYCNYKYLRQGHMNIRY